MKKVDCILVGQGLAGSIMAYKLLEIGKSFVIYSDTDGRDASMIAGGIVNPIAGRAMMPSWHIEQILPNIIPFYTSLNSALGTKIFWNTRLHKVIDNIEQLNDWQSLDNPYYGDITTPTANIRAEYGLGQIIDSFRIDTSQLISSCKKLFSAKEMLKEEMFVYERIKIFDNDITYEDIQAQYIIFSEGYKGRNNPLFSFIPWTFAKGEIITVHCPDLKIDYALNKNVLIIPIGNDRYKIGATFDRHHLDTETSTAGLSELKEKLDAVLKCSYTIIKHEAGIRPTSRDRKPFIGRHPRHDNVFIFNGLGSKGVSQAPFYADRLIANIWEGKTIDVKVDVNRYYR